VTIAEMTHSQEASIGGRIGLVMFTREEASVRKLIGGLAIAGVVLAGSVAAAKTPDVSIELAHNSVNEQQVKDQLQRLLKEYDLSRTDPLVSGREGA